MAVDRILVVDDELIIRKSMEEVLRAKRYAVSSAPDLATAEKLLARDSFDMVFVDVRLPDGEGTSLLERFSKMRERPQVVVMTGYGSIESAVECMQLGALDYLIKPFSLSQVEVLVKKAEAYTQVLNVNRHLIQEASATRDLVGKSAAMLRLRHMIKRVAATEATVLICGENGTGKELVANEIFSQSPRAQTPYIKINCAAVAENLIESEFFGHEKGAFTGATERRIGRFELADGGTLLLDEVSEIAPHLQAKLLRVLQEREFERVGGAKTIKVDVRILATTNRDLKEAVAKGEFREDLYYRLSVFPLPVPPLRQRKEDIPEIAGAFLKRFAHRHRSPARNFSDAAMTELMHHDWPGNVRELQNTVERAVILADDEEELQPQWLGLRFPTPDHMLSVTLETPAPEPASPADSGGIQPLGAVEKEHILRALERTGGNRTHAAEKLGISIRTLRNKLNEYRIEDEGSRGPGQAED